MVRLILKVSLKSFDVIQTCVDRKRKFALETNFVQETDENENINRAAIWFECKIFA